MHGGIILVRNQIMTCLFFGGFFLFQTELKGLNKNARWFFRVCQKCLSVQCADIRDEVRHWGGHIVMLWMLWMRIILFIYGL